MRRNENGQKANELVKGAKQLYNNANDALAYAQKPHEKASVGDVIVSGLTYGPTSPQTWIKLNEVLNGKSYNSGPAKLFEPNVKANQTYQKEISKQSWRSERRNLKDEYVQARRGKNVYIQHGNPVSAGWQTQIGPYYNRKHTRSNRGNARANGSTPRFKTSSQRGQGRGKQLYQRYNRVTSYTRRYASRGARGYAASSRGKGRKGNYRSW